MKRITIISMLLLFVFAGKAQLFNIGGFGVGYLYLGPKIGGNASFNSIDLGAGAEKTANYGYQFGGVAKFGVTKKLSIQPELAYTSKGYSQKFATGQGNSNYKYIGIPVIAKYAFAAISGVQIYGAGGFYTDVLTGVNVLYTQNNFNEKVTDLSPFTRVDFGFNIGAGADIPFKNKDQLNIDFRLTYGLTQTEDIFGISKGRSTSLQLSAIYLFDLTKWISFKGKSILEDDAYEPQSAPAGGTKVDR